MSSSKTDPGRFFEDFQLGQTIDHATPRTVGEGERALYIALTGSRFALASSDEFARRLKLPSAPLDDILVFNLVFGRSVPDISLNAVANLGYADGRFGAAVYAGDTLSARSEVIGLRENSNRETGVVYVRTTGLNQRGESVLSYVRWVMVRKRERNAPAPQPSVPSLPASLGADALQLPAGIDLAGYDTAVAGSAHYWDDYEAGEKIDHVDGMTIEEVLPYERHAALSEHRAGAFRSACAKGGTLRPPPRLWRPCHQPGPRAQLQRPRQCLSHRRHQWRAASQSLLCRRYGLCLDEGGRENPDCRAGAIAARCAWSLTPRKTGPAAIFRPKAAMSSSSSTTPRSCPSDPDR